MSRHSTGETYPNEECSLDVNIEVIDVNNETNDDLEIEEVVKVDLSQEIFVDIYSLTDDLEVDQIHLNLKKTPNLYSNISYEEFKKTYDLLKNIKCIKSSRKKITEIENDRDYTIDFRVKNDQYRRLFNINIGESYLLSLIAEKNYIYIHDINEEDYQKIIELLSNLD